MLLRDFLQQVVKDNLKDKVIIFDFGRFEFGKLNEWESELIDKMVVYNLHIENDDIVIVVNKFDERA